MKKMISRRNFLTAAGVVAAAGVLTLSLIHISWHRKVAQATPATPISKAATNSTSTAMFAVEEPARNRNGVRLSPSAVKMPVATL